METPTIETLRPPEAETVRKFDDATTWAAEVLKGSMRTTFEFTYSEGELYGHDGLPLTPVFEDAYEHAKKQAVINPKLAFEVRRTGTERGELDDLKAMARGEGPNTLVIESDFPEELQDSPVDVGGYNVERKQAMLRVIYRQPDGQLVMVSQSLEGSDRKSLEAIREHLGYDTEPGELLGQRMALDMNPEDQEFLVDELCGVYDRKLSEKNGGEYRAGWKLPEGRASVNTYDFVLQQDDLIQAFINDTNPSPDSLYGFAAAMQKRYEQTYGTQAQSVPFTEIGFITGNPVAEMFHAAVEARAEGTVFSGCGVSVGRNGELSTRENLGQAGYGEKSDEDKYGSLTFKCPKGHGNRRPRGKLIPNCQKCGVDVRC